MTPNPNGHLHLPRRILMTADAVGGVWTYALELARGLQPYDVEVDLALMGPPLSTDRRREAADIPNLNIFKSDFKLEWMPNCWTDMRRAQYWLLNLEARLRPEVVHLNGYAHAVLPWRAPTVVVGHSCVYSWWQAVREGTPSGEWHKYKSAVTHGLNSANAVVAPTQAMLEALNRIYGGINRGRVIPNGLDATHFRRAEKEPIVLSAGRIWDEAKNIRVIAEVAADLPWPVCLAGDPQSPNGDGDVPHQKNCFHLGHLQNGLLRDWFARAAIYALPARYEPFGLSVLEAALSGCALVLGKIDSLTENWRDAAIFVDPADREALKAALIYLIDHKAHREQMAELALERAQEFTTARMTEQYVNLYSELLVTQKSRIAEEELAACA